MRLPLFFVLCIATFVTAKPPIGFPNCGNSCYMNATIQTLYNMKELKKFVIENKELYKRNAFVSDFANLLSIIDSGNQKNIGRAIQSFYLTHVNKDFKQDDAGALLTALFKSLVTLPDPTTAHSPAEKNALIQAKKIVNSLITQTSSNQIFVGTTLDKSEEFEHSMIYLYIKPTATSLQDLLEDYSKPERYPVYITKEGTKTSASGFTKLTHLAHYVIFRINWFNTFANSVRPHIPETLTLGQAEPYKLISSIIHIGSTLDGGHYIAYVKTDGSWYKCDDATIIQEQPFIIAPTALWPSYRRPTIAVYEREELDHSLKKLSDELSVLSTVFR